MIEELTKYMLTDGLLLPKTLCGPCAMGRTITLCNGSCTTPETAIMLLLIANAGLPPLSILDESYVLKMMELFIVNSAEPNPAAVPKKYSESL